MGKTLRNSPLAIAAAALAAAPPAGAQPMPLTPPERPEQAQPAAPRPAPAQPAAGAPLATPITPAAQQEPAELRGPIGPLPADFSIAAAPPPPPPPAPPPPPPPPPPVQAAAAPAAAPPPPPPRMDPAPNATVSVGVQGDYTRLAFRFAGPTTVAPTMQGNRLELRFSRGADIDIAELRASPPRFVREVRRTSAAGQPVRLSLTLDHGVRQRSFADGNRVVVDLLAPDEAAQQAAAANGEAPAPARPPVRGNATVALVEAAAGTEITVTWPAPARAAAFRRGEAIWLLFDASGQIGLSGVARVGRRHQDIEIVRGEGVIGLRVPAPPDVQVSARADDNSWVFTLGARAEASVSAPTRRELAADGRGQLTATFGREGAVRWISDPEIGDRIAVALIGGPPMGVGVRRATMEAAVLPAAHGAVVEPRADDVSATFANGALVVTRGDGLIAAGAEGAPAQTGANAAALEAALLTGGEEPVGESGMSLVEIRRRLDDLTRRAAAEGVREGAPVDARMALARFLLQNEFAPEALGALRIVAINQGELVELDPEYRLLRGAANVMMGRIHDAEADLGSSALMEDPSAALWRGYAAYQKQDWAEARRELERGAGALEQHPPGWRARFQLALANAAFELNDYPAAAAASRAAMAQAPNQNVRLQARMVEARLAAVTEDAEAALAMLEELSRVRDEEVAVRASLEALRIRRNAGLVRAIDAVEPLEALRFRWRGDSTELLTVGLLGDVYSEQGRWREAMATMRTAADRYPMDPAARRLRADMTTLFERLFLDGEADQLEPIQALGLFYEFSDLTPVGPNGDRIVRLLAGRLVHVDLLEQAATLLQHQVDERLEGIGKAQVAADLAAIYLMNHQAERALVALNSSRQPNMPAALLAERRILEARAMLGLGRLDHAVELVERDRSADAQSVRAEAAWRARDWDRATAELRALLALHDSAAPFDAADRQTVLRAGIAMTLGGNEEGVRALYREYAGELAGTPEADSFEVIASGVHAEGAAIRDLARVVARTDLLDRFMTRLRTRMTAEAAAGDAAQGGPEAPAEAPAPAPAAAPPPRQQAAPEA
ncbi:MAG: hypothetical protein AB7G05_06925 [Hyphomonadaceae bacterium]